MKTAVFQINDCDGAAHLVCVPMPSLHAACSLETWMRMYAGPERTIQLLGRFDSVRTVMSEEEAEVLMLREGAAGRESAAIEKLPS
jgi:hypothetical protein